MSEADKSVCAECNHCRIRLTEYVEKVLELPQHISTMVEGDPANIRCAAPANQFQAAHDHVLGTDRFVDSNGQFHDTSDPGAYELNANGQCTSFVRRNTPIKRSMCPD